MAWMFRPGVHGAIVGRDLVVLDLNKDAYMCVPAACDVPLGSAGDLDRLQGDVITLLVESGLIIYATSPPKPLSQPVVATQDLRSIGCGRVRSTQALVPVLRAAFALRNAGPDPAVSLLMKVARGALSPTSQDRDAVIRYAAQFDRLSPWLPGKLECLQRSALLVRYLAERGLCADWVFGVRTWPFRAHCWVQIADICLTDDAERLRPYTVIYSL